MRVSFIPSLLLVQWVLQDVAVLSFAPQSKAIGKSIPLKTEFSPSALFGVNDDEEKSSALFSTANPDHDKAERSKAPAPKEEDGTLDMTKLGIQAGAALLAVLVVLGASSFVIDMVTSAAGALGGELQKEAGNLLGNVVWALGAIGGTIAGAAWEGTKAAAPVVGKAVVEGAKVAAPVVQEATRQVTEAAAPVVQEAAKQVAEAATPVVQEATRQVTEAAAPYMDSVSSAVADSVSTVSSTVDSTIVTPLSTTVDSVNSAVDTTLVAPIMDAADVVSSTVESVNTKVDETLVAPIKSAGDAIKGFKFF